MLRALASVALLAMLVVATAGCGGNDTAGGGESTAASTTSVGASGCTPVDVPAPRDDGGAAEPEEALDPAQEATLEFVTNCGSFTIALDVEGAPNTSASLVALARADFYDDTVFHRIVPGFVIQGGDPTQTGSGGPGYQTVDAPSQDAAYTRGVVAMAKTQAEPPGTSGSQFFVVTGADIGLPPDYAIVGTVTSGLEVVERIGALGDAQEQPTEPVVVSDVIVTAGP
ncbi:MAG: peptidylprolyl isomerase [Gaiellaceae bacterium]